MVQNARQSEQRLSPSQVNTYRVHAQKILRSSYNLFAEISLRLIMSHDSLAAENESLRQVHTDRQLEIEFLARENQELHAVLADLQIERRRLVEQIKQQQSEIDDLRRHKLQLPPSWQ